MITTRKELAQLYNLSHDTIRIRLNEIGIKNRIRLCPKDIMRIYDALGNPETVYKTGNVELMNDIESSINQSKIVNCKENH